MSESLFDRSRFSRLDPAQIRRVVLTVILLVAASVIVAWLLYALRMVILLLAFTALFCYLIAPLVDFVEHPLQLDWKLPRGLAITIVYLVFIGGIVLSVEYLVPRLSEQISAFSDNVPTYAQKLDQYMNWVERWPSRYRLPFSWRQSLLDWMTASKQAAIEWLKAMVSQTFRLALFLPWLLVIPVIGFFFLKDAKTLSSRFLSSLPEADLRYRVAIFLSDVSETLARYIRSQVIACVFVGIVEGLGLWLIGVSYALIFAIAAAILEFIPMVGPVVLGLAAITVANFHSDQSVVIVAGFLITFRIIHDYLIYPRLVGAGVEIHPVIVILAVICGAELGGVIGIFLSVPIVALLIVCFRHWRDLTTTNLQGRIAVIETLPSELRHTARPN
ncbi:MAG: AI-2E family transporter [Acidobacteria bacterium]|nr:AI-2E family transporter [Acidobacteriota bacterium]